MISGYMFWYKSDESLADKVKFLLKAYKLKDVKYVLVNNKLLKKEILIDNLKIKPNKMVLEDNFWFISENNLEKDPNPPISEK